MTQVYFFPRCKVWLTNINRTDLLNNQIVKSKYICEDHFDLSCIIPHGKGKRVLYGATPAATSVPAAPAIPTPVNLDHSYSSSLTCKFRKAPSNLDIKAYADWIQSN